MSENDWISPPASMVVKINSDAYLITKRWIGIGVVVRDGKRDVLFAATRRVRAWWSSEIAKSKVLLLAIKLAKRHGYDN